MRSVSHDMCRDRTPVLYCYFVFFLENRSVYERRWKNIVEPGRPQMKIWRMSIECSIPKATDIHLEYVILIAFPPQQRLRERSSLRYAYITCVVILKRG
jgi:hypothetical protein